MSDDDNNVVRLGDKRRAQATKQREQREYDLLAWRLEHDLDDETREKILADGEFVAHNLNYMEQTRKLMRLAREAILKRGLIIPSAEITKELDGLSGDSVEQLCQKVRAYSWAEWPDHAARFCAIEIEYELRNRDILPLFRHD